MKQLFTKCRIVKIKFGFHYNEKKPKNVNFFIIMKIAGFLQLISAKTNQFKPQNYVKISAFYLTTGKIKWQKSLVSVTHLWTANLS